MYLSLDAETLEQIVSRLEREVQHVSEQCQVSHRMAMYFREKYRATEEERQRLETKLKPKQQREAHIRQEEAQSNINARFGLFLDEEDADEAV